MVTHYFAIRAEGDRFGTASRAKVIAVTVPDGRAIVFPSNGHAIVGHYGDVLRDITNFLRALQKRPSS